MRANFDKHVLRGIEKIPGINLMQYVEINGFKIVMTPKVGTRSIRDAVLRIKHVEDINNKKLAWSHIEYVTRSQFLKSMNNEETVMFLRDPFDRLHSCWRQKISIQRDSGFFYYFQYYPFIYPNMSFLAFLQAISRIPTLLYEKHFLPISYGMDVKNLRLKMYRMVDIDRILTQVSGLSEIPFSNKTANTSDIQRELEYFNLHLAKRYAGDFYLLNVASNSEHSRLI